MTRYELPVLISERDGVYSVAIAVTDNVVVSRRLSRADLLQLQARLNNMLDQPGQARED